MDEKIYFITSDIHGSLTSLGMVISRAKEEKATDILISGDLCIPNYEFYIAIKNSPFNFHIVRGNSDNIADMIEYNKVPYPLTLELSYNDKSIFMSHGDRYYDPKYSDLVITGHTHIPHLYKENGTIYLNPGSPTNPRGNEGKTYALLKENTISIYSFSTRKVLTSLDISSL